MHQKDVMLSFDENFIEKTIKENYVNWSSAEFLLELMSQNVMLLCSIKESYTYGRLSLYQENVEFFIENFKIKNPILLDKNFIVEPAELEIPIILDYLNTLNLLIKKIKEATKDSVSQVLDYIHNVENKNISNLRIDIIVLNEIIEINNEANKKEKNLLRQWVLRELMLLMINKKLIREKIYIM